MPRTVTILSVLTLWELVGDCMMANASPIAQCQAAKLKAAGKKVACLAGEQSKAVLGRPMNQTKCEVAFAAAFAKAEAAAAKAGEACPVTGDAAAIEHRVDVTLSGIAQIIAGEGRFHDNGDGTITDANTGLMWEKKDRSGGLHDVNNTYDWTTVTGTWITQINTEGGMGFAGHNDWRVPSLSELEGIVDYGAFDPPVPTAFNMSCTALCSVLTCSCTTSTAFNSGYWSATPYFTVPSAIWFVGFGDGQPSFTGKSNTLSVRAVRDSH